MDHDAHGLLILSLNPIHDFELCPFFFLHFDHEYDLSLPVFYGSELVWLVRLPAFCGRLLRLLEHPSEKEVRVSNNKMKRGDYYQSSLFYSFILFSNAGHSLLKGLISQLVLDDM